MGLSQSTGASEGGTDGYHVHGVINASLFVIMSLRVVVGGEN